MVNILSAYLDCMPTLGSKSSTFLNIYIILTKLSLVGSVKNSLRRGGEGAQRRRSPKEETAMSIRVVPDSRLILSLSYSKSRCLLNANRHYL